ncbi:MAG TPA: CoA transferase, partial [Acidimicrobiales bacterium]|nr:CoA transferase [Acidimicrobiales bacterium]
MSTEDAQRVSALSDLRIIDMATIVAGPAAAKYLGDFGAEVIKVEAPAGDSTRRLGWGLREGDDSFFWKLIGRNKKCVTLDLKTENGLKRMLKLIDSSDALIEN